MWQPLKHIVWNSIPTTYIAKLRYCKTAIRNDVITWKKLSALPAFIWGDPTVSSGFFVVSLIKLLNRNMFNNMSPSAYVVVHYYSTIGNKTCSGNVIFTKFSAAPKVHNRYLLCKFRWLSSGWVLAHPFSEIKVNCCSMRYISEIKPQSCEMISFIHNTNWYGQSFQNSVQTRVLCKIIMHSWKILVYVAERCVMGKVVLWEWSLGWV